MKNVLISFLMGIIVGGGAVWYVVEPDGTPGLQEIGQRVETAAQNINETGVAAADHVRLSTKSGPPVIPKSGPPAIDGRSYFVSSRT